MTDTQDEPLKRDLAVDVVGTREVRRSRERRDEDRTVTERREISDDARLAAFRQQMFNDALPDLPNIPGYHVCWLTTTNPRDSIQMRTQQGYSPVQSEDVPGLEYATLKTGEYAGLIGVNEMLAFKLPLDLYQGYMQIAHHERPRHEEEKIRDAIQAMQQRAEQAGAALIEDEGITDLREQHPARGKFHD